VQVSQAFTNQVGFVSFDTLHQAEAFIPEHDRRISIDDRINESDQVVGRRVLPGPALDIAITLRHGRTFPNNVCTCPV
jgi:hypothetical protein